MAKIQILNPNDQPTGRWRLINELRSALNCDDYDSLFMAVAFAKSGPLLRLQGDIENWCAKGKRIESIFGVNHRNTSKQALEFAVEKFTQARVLFYSDDFTYHPKMYLFIGPQKCLFLIGSHNLTVGGTETNWESGTRVSLKLPEDQEMLTEAIVAWNAMWELSADLDAAIIQQYVALGKIVDEFVVTRKPASGAGLQAGTDIAAQPRLIRPKLTIKPPSPLPKNLFSIKPKKHRPAPSSAETSQYVKQKVSAEALVIQIVPHHNGEVFLSKLAVNQYPDFFGFPFTGRTSPKKKNNPSYPQREPDPIVDLTVYGKEAPVLHLTNLALNTVFYEIKSEIRITVPPEVVRNAPPYSILIMRQAPDDSNCDYEMDIFPPGSQQFNDYLAVCNQILPSGGKDTPRRMGWL